MFYLSNKSHSFKSKFLNKIKPLQCLSYYRLKSYYAVLGLNSEASAKEIKSAYYDLSRQHHPDKNNGSPESVAKFREITEAYEVLGNPEKKRRYDQETTFHSQYSRSNSYNGNYYQPRSTRGPYTGKTRQYDYDEHFKQHYEEMNRRREAEYEYFKKRWESDFLRRYPTFEEFYRRNPNDDKEYYREATKRHFAQRRQSFFILFGLWVFILSIHTFKEVLNPDIMRPKVPVYYSSRTDDKKQGNE